MNLNRLLCSILFRRDHGRSPRRFGAGLSMVLALAIGIAGVVPAGVVQAKNPDQWEAGELLVKLRDGVTPTRARGIFNSHGVVVVDEIRQINLWRISGPPGALDAHAKVLARLPEVEFVEYNYLFDPVLLPNDPQYPNQWHLPQILAPQAWDVTQGAPGVVIGIIDSGVDPYHPDLASKLVAGYNTYNNNTNTADNYGHGTEVAGAAAALSDNALGIAGVAGLSPVMPVRVTNNSGRATSATIASGIVWATDHGASVLNLSFGSVAGNATIQTAAAYAFNHSALVVAASGNCGCVDTTAETPYMLSVSATDETDSLAYFSSTGPYVDLSAPGTNILTTVVGGLYFSDSGTSLASPVVAGVAALMFSANPALTPELVTQLLESTAVDFGGAGYDQGFGYGRVNAAAAVAAAAGYVPPADTTPPSVAVTAPAAGATVSGTVVVDVAAADNVGVAQVDLYVDGALFATDSLAPYSFAWDSTAVANGSHTLQAVATDAAGNSASTAPMTVSVSNAPPDTTPPTVAISAPADGATVSGTTTVSASATDNVGVVKVDFYVDGVLKATDTSAPYSYAWDATASGSGAHTLRADASDAAANTATATISVTVSIANQAPVAANDSFSAPYWPKANYTAQVFAVLANDSDPDGSLNVASVKIVGSPNQGGSVTVNTNGTVSYKPKKGYQGTESFTYNVKDNLGATSNTATVTVTVQ